jgi:circadian clock protein KaiC
MQEILEAVRNMRAKRLVIDSLAGFEMALAPGFREDFKESLYRFIGALTRTGVTIVSTAEIGESFINLPFSPYSLSFLADDIVLLKYAFIESQLRKIMMIAKMRGRKHSNDIREYEIASEGLKLGGLIKHYAGSIPGFLR